MADSSIKPRICCDEFANACKIGTDNEAYGRLIDWWADEWHIGHELREPHFCPWCGSDLMKRKLERPKATEVG